MSIINDFVAYVKQTWENRPSTKSPVSAERLGYMEDGIKENSDAIEKVAAAVLSTIVNDPDKIASMAALYAVNQTVAANAVAITELNSNLQIITEYITVSVGEIEAGDTNYNVYSDYVKPEGYSVVSTNCYCGSGCSATNCGLGTNGRLSATVSNFTTQTRSPSVTWEIILIKKEVHTYREATIQAT